MKLKSLIPVILVSGSVLLGGCAVIKDDRLAVANDEVGVVVEWNDAYQPEFIFVSGPEGADWGTESWDIKTSQTATNRPYVSILREP